MLHPSVFIVPPTVPPVEDPVTHMAAGKALVPTVLRVL